MAGKIRANSKRQIAIGVFNTEVSALKAKKIDIATHLGDSAIHKEFRGGILKNIIAKCLAQDIPEPSVGCLGALYNDARHTAIQDGTCEPFGRYGKGSNGSSKESQLKRAAEAKAKLEAQMADDELKWALQDKETGAIFDMYPSQPAAKEFKTDELVLRKKEVAYKKHQEAQVAAEAAAKKAEEEAAALKAKEEEKAKKKAEREAKAEATKKAKEAKAAEKLKKKQEKEAAEAEEKAKKDAEANSDAEAPAQEEATA